MEVFSTKYTNAIDMMCKNNTVTLSSSNNILNYKKNQIAYKNMVKLSNMFQIIIDNIKMCPITYSNDGSGSTKNNYNIYLVSSNIPSNSDLRYHPEGGPIA